MESESDQVIEQGAEDNQTEESDVPLGIEEIARGDQEKILEPDVFSADRPVSSQDRQKKQGKCYCVEQHENVENIVVNRTL